MAQTPLEPAPNFASNKQTQETSLPQSLPVFIHPSALVEDDVELGPGVRIWHHCHIRRGARIGAGTSLGKNCYVDAQVTIGQGCKIQNNVSIYTGVIIEDDVFIGPGVIFTNDFYPRAFLPWNPQNASSTLIKKGASLGAGACVRCGIEVGEYSMIGMGAVLTKSTSPFELWLGHPAKKSGMVDIQGRPVK